MKQIIFVIAVLSTLSWAGCRLVNSIRFNQQCGGNLKRAADANTVEIAQRELGTAITYMEANGLTSGYTSILWRTPDEDVSFWYNNIKTAHDELKSLGSTATPMEKSNMLIKLRETLLDHGGEDGDHLTAPIGISVYPNNLAWMLFGLLSMIVAILSGIVVFGDDDY